MVQVLNPAPETVGTGAPDETMIAGVWGDTILVNHHSGFLWANPSHQSASFDRRTRVWTDWPREGEEVKWDVGAYGYVNSQAGGVSVTVAPSATRTMHRGLCTRQLPRWGIFT